MFAVSFLMDCVSSCHPGSVASVDKPPPQGENPSLACSNPVPAPLRDVTAIPSFGNAPCLLQYPGGSCKNMHT